MFLTGISKRTRMRAWRRRRTLCAAALTLLFCAAARAQKTVALTFDDLPAASFSQNPAPAAIAQQQRITTAILETLRSHHAPATGFVNEVKMNTPGARDAYAALLQAWLDAGMDLGCHGYSHLYLSDTALEDYELDFARGTVMTPLLMRQAGRTEQFYRYPYNDTGDTREKRDGFAAFLVRQHYRVAPMTIENDDWLYSALYSPGNAPASPDMQGRLRAAYLDENARKLAFVEALSAREFHRDIPQVADLHVNEVNADTLDALLTQFEQHGYRFVTLASALADPAYSTPDGFTGRGGISWLERWAPSLGFSTDFRDDPDPPDWVMQAYKAAQK